MDEGTVISDRGDHSAWMIRYQDYQVSTHWVQCHWSLEAANQRTVFRVLTNEGASHLTLVTADYLSLGALNATQISVAADHIYEMIHSEQWESWSWMWIFSVYWQAQETQALEPLTITQTEMQLHRVCKYLPWWLLSVSSLKSYEWMFMQTSDSYWKLETP